MKLPTPICDDIVTWVTDTYHKIPAKSTRRTFTSIGYNCDKEISSSDMDSITVVEEFEEEGTINTHDLYLHVPTY
jgi:hypothetical protein